MSRSSMLAKLHIAKKELGLEDADYRVVLARVTGRDSGRDCTDQELHALIQEFTRLGWTRKKSSPRSAKPWVRKVWAIWGDLRPLLDNATDDTLRAFCRRQTTSQKNPGGIADPEWLDPIEAKRVIHGLEGWLTRVRKGLSHVD